MTTTTYTSLADQAKAIVEGKGSRSEKVKALMAIGVDRNSALIYVSRNVAPAQPAYRFTFGVEIECLVARENVDAAAAVTGVDYQYEGYNHKDGKKHFKFVTDGSLSAGGIECVSPILRGADGRKAMRNICDTLNRASAKVDKSCGLHVHIGASHLTEQEYANVFCNYFYLETLIDSFMAASRRNNYYCRSIQGCNPQYYGSREGISFLFGCDRYYKINPISYQRHGTIEFRQHQGTTDYRKIINWVAFCGKLVEWSRKHRLTSAVQSIDDIPFLNSAEKRFFKQRQQHFAAQPQECVA
jgi:hypothetical protein